MRTENLLCSLHTSSTLRSWELLQQKRSTLFLTLLNICHVLPLPEDSSEFSLLTYCCCSSIFGIVPKCQNIGCHFSVTASFRRSSETVWFKALWSELCIQISQQFSQIVFLGHLWVQGEETWESEELVNLYVLSSSSFMCNVWPGWKEARKLKKRCRELHITGMCPCFCYVHLKRDTTGNVALYCLINYVNLLKLFLMYKKNKIEKQAKCNHITNDQL